MTTVTAQSEGGVLRLALHGRIDSASAPEAEKQIEEVRTANAAKSVVVDAEDLEYISSAGLRVLLRLKKNIPDMKIVNVSSDVYEVFEMTGFTEMIDIEKAYRKISVEGCEIIGRGANGEVYRLDPDTIIKVYLNPDSLPDIQRERELARKAFVLGIPTAIPYDVVKVGNGYGSVFELLNAKSLTKILASDPSKFDEVLHAYVDLLKKIHATEAKAGDMPDMKKTVVGWVDFLKDYLAPAKWEKLSALVRAVPENTHVIHGDYHTKNVMIQNGEVLLIDMDTLSLGDPVFEFASMFNAFCGFSALDHSVAQNFIGLPYETTTRLWEETLPLYFGTKDPAFLQGVKDRAALLGYTRLMRRLIRRKGLDDEEGRKTIAFYREQIETLVDGIDRLSF